MSANDLIWLAVAAGAMLCAGLLGLLVAIEFLPRLLGREEMMNEAPRPRPRTSAAPSRPSAPLVSIPEVPRHMVAPRMEPQRRAAPPPAPLLPPRSAPKSMPPRLVAPAAPVVAPRAQPAYNLDFDEAGATVGLHANAFAPDDEEDVADMPTVSIDRHTFESGAGEFALYDRD